MKTKTCGECFFYNPKITRNDCGMCTATTGHFKGMWVDPAMKVCKWACTKNVKKKPKPPITNGDKIRQMRNKELVDTIEELAFKFSGRSEFLAWLNAPADCVKQNENDNTQTDLSKADHTESEGKDE